MGQKGSYEFLTVFLINCMALMSRRQVFYKSKIIK